MPKNAFIASSIEEYKTKTTSVPTTNNHHHNDHRKRLRSNIVDSTTTTSNHHHQNKRQRISMSTHHDSSSPPASSSSSSSSLSSSSSSSSSSSLKSRPNEHMKVPLKMTNSSSSSSSGSSTINRRSSLIAEETRNNVPSVMKKFRETHIAASPNKNRVTSTTNSLFSPLTTNNNNSSGASAGRAIQVKSLHSAPKKLLVRERTRLFDETYDNDVNDGGNDDDDDDDFKEMNDIISVRKHRNKQQTSSSNNNLKNANRTGSSSGTSMLDVHSKTKFERLPKIHSKSAAVDAQHGNKTYHSSLVSMKHVEVDEDLFAEEKPTSKTKGAILDSNSKTKRKSHVSGDDSNSIYMMCSATKCKFLSCDASTLKLSIFDSYITCNNAPSWQLIQFSSKYSTERYHMKKTKSMPECFAFRYSENIYGVDITYFDCDSSKNRIVIVNTKGDVSMNDWFGDCTEITHDQLIQKMDVDLEKLLKRPHHECSSILSSPTNNKSISQDFNSSFDYSFKPDRVQRLSSFSNRSAPSPRLTTARKRRILDDDVDTDEEGQSMVLLENRTKQASDQSDDCMIWQNPSEVIVKKYNIHITNGDLVRLNDGEFLNDNIIDYWYQHISHSELGQKHKGKFILLNSQFYPVLRNDVVRCSQRTASGEKLFESELIFVPVCESAHWTLFVICNPTNLIPPQYRDNKVATDDDQCMIMYCDSLGNHPNRRVISNLRNFLEQRYKFEYPDRPAIQLTDDNIPVHSAQLPQQDNFCDCGVYILQYTEEIVRRYFDSKEARTNDDDATELFELPVNNSRLFLASTVSRKRKYIRKQLVSLAHQMGPPSQNVSSSSIVDEDDVMLLSQDPSKTDTKEPESPSF